MYKKYVQFLIFLIVIIIIYLIFNRALASTKHHLNESVNLVNHDMVVAHVWNVDTPLLDQSLNSNEQIFYQSRYEQLTDKDKKEIEILVKTVSIAEFNKNTQQPISNQQASAAWELGLLHLHGIAKEASIFSAEKFFEISWHGGEKKASLGLAWCSISGCKSAPNRQAQNKWINEIKKFNYGRAIYLEWFKEMLNAPITSSTMSEPNSKPIDFNHHDILLEALKHGDIQAQIELGIEASQENNLKKSLSYFQSAATKSILATRKAQLISEKIKRKKIQKNVNAQNSSNESINFLVQAVKFHRGDGVPSNYYLAIEFYKKAANLGNKNAKKMLGLIFSKSPSSDLIDIAWMRQLSQIDVFSEKWDYDYSTGPKLVMRDITPISDYLPTKWQRLLYLN